MPKRDGGRIAVWREMKKDTELEKKRDTQGFVDERLHNWVLQGDWRGGGVRRSWQTGRRQCNKACQNENLLLANSSAPVPPTLHLHEICVDKKRAWDRTLGWEGARRQEL